MPHLYSFFSGLSSNAKFFAFTFVFFAHLTKCMFFKWETVKDPQIFLSGILTNSVPCVRSKDVQWEFGGNQTEYYRVSHAGGSG